MTRTCPEGHASQSEDYCDVCGIAMAPDSTGAGEPDATAPDLAPVRGTTQECPNCAAANPADALFCEACGYDYTTGTMPRPLEPLLVLPEPGVPLPQPEGAPDGAPDAGAGPDTETADEPAVEDAPGSEGVGDVPSTATPDPSPAPALDEPWVAEVWIDPDWYHDQGSADSMPSPGLPTVVALRHTSSLIGRASRSRGIAPDVDISGDPGVSRRHAQLTTDGSRWFIEDLGSANGTYVGAAASGPPSSPITSGQKREIAAGEQVYLGAWTRIVVREAAEGEL
ncbi:MAG: FHA domain-containing protein [Dermatophilaceae bacterium]|nr:zinc-ribbon and FHA domain-containing protein [Intrasporangiaceae bacterium]